jgi:DNA polymerase-3 subunit gamma/tau
VISTTPHQALYRRWRAQTFGEIVGQQPVVTTLRNAVRANAVAHAMLFVGPRGTGKTSMARILAKALNCTNLQDGEPDDACEACVAIREGRALDVVEMDAASNNKVDDMRDLLPRVYTAPSDLRRKVFIVDEVQRIKEGWDVLLKTLEEPPEHVVFIFCTTDSSQIRPAIVSRLQRFDFRRLTVPEIEGKLRRILGEDGRPADDDAIRLIGELAAGGMRDAESMLDQLLSGGSERLTAEGVRDLLGLADAETVRTFVDAAVEGDARAGMDVLDALEERGRDLRSFMDQAVEALRSRMSAALGAGAAIDRRALLTAAHRLAAIDPARGGPGGLRFQLELALLAGATETEQTRQASALETEHAHQASAIAAAPAKVAAPAPPPRRKAEDAKEREARASSDRTPQRPPLSEPEPAAPASEKPAASAPAPDQPPTAASEEPAASAPAPDQPPTAASDQPTAPAASGDLQTLRARWPEIVAAISQHPPTKPLIVACRPVSVEDGVVTLGFPEGQSFLKDVAERRRSVLEEGIGRLLGRPVAVRCVATNLDVDSLGGDEEGARLLAEARRIFAEDLVDAREVS